MFWGSKKSDDEKAAAKRVAPPEKITSTTTSRTTATDTRTQPRVGGRPQTSVGQKIVPRDELPQFLVTEGHISEEDIRHALKVQEETGVFFGEVLANEGVLGSQSLVSFLAKNCKIPHIGLLDYLIDKSLLALIPEELCWKYHLLPVDKMGKNLTVAMVNPLNNEAMVAVQKVCPDLRVKPILCSNEHFETVAKKLFGEDDEHDEAVMDVEEPVAAATQVVAEPASKVSEGDRHDQEQLPESSTAVEETVEAPSDVAESQTIPAAAKESLHPESNRLLESVFGQVQQPLASQANENKEEASPLSPEEMGTLESVMRSYTDVMVNSMHETYELLARKISFFKGISPEDVAKIFAQGNVVEYEQAQMLFDKGDSGNTMFVILNGRVKIRDGAKQIAILHTGDIFGEMSLVSDAPRSATAVTMTQTDLLVLSFDDILHNIPPQVAAQLLVNIIITLAGRLRTANQADDS